jgi:HEAT repeat protein
VLLEQLFDAERRVRQFHRELGRASAADLLELVERAISDAAKLEADDAEANLVCLARLLGERDGAPVVDALIDVLGSDLPGARIEAGEQLLGIAQDAYEDVAHAVGRALKRLPHHDPALTELPYLLAETRHDEAAEPLAAMLRHPHGDVVAAAIDALVTLGDPVAIGWLAPLEQDDRSCVLTTDDDEQVSATVGELARQAVELLSALGRPASPPTETEPSP